MTRSLFVVAITAPFAAFASKPEADQRVAGILPAPVVEYRCEPGEQLAVRLDGPSATIRLNGDALTLPRLTRPGGEDPEAPRTFTNGRLTFVQEIEGAKRVSFARGKMVPAPCTAR